LSFRIPSAASGEESFTTLGFLTLIEMTKSIFQKSQSVTL